MKHESKMQDGKRRVKNKGKTRRKNVSHEAKKVDIRGSGGNRTEEKQLRVKHQISGRNVSANNTKKNI